DDPKKMMEALKGVHMQQKPGNRFNALNNPLSIQKGDDETLSTLIGHVSAAIQLLRDLTPVTVPSNSLISGSKPYILKDLYDDLQSMALLCALPTEYDTLTCPLLVSEDLSIQKIINSSVPSLTDVVRILFHARK
ncbi:hypothetical protein L218DRAFT_887328, partial [Marasmius fiardii PR-910]